MRFDWRRGYAFLVARSRAPRGPEDFDALFVATAGLALAGFSTARLGVTFAGAGFFDALRPTARPPADGAALVAAGLAAVWRVVAAGFVAGRFVVVAGLAAAGRVVTPGLAAAGRFVPTAGFVVAERVAAAGFAAAGRLAAAGLAVALGLLVTVADTVSTVAAVAGPFRPLPDSRWALEPATARWTGSVVPDATNWAKVSSTARWTSA